MPVNETKRVRLVDVAEKAGVSRAVVGHVLFGTGGKSTRVSAATADRVLAAAKELDYQPNVIARQLLGERTRTLAALVDADRYTIYYDRMRAMDIEADRLGYRLMASYLHRDQKQAADELLEQLNDMVGRGAEGVILIRGLAHWPDHILRRLEQVNLVVCGNSPEIANACHVTVDLAAGIEQLVQHLARTGRRRLVMLLPKTGTASINRRSIAFAAALRKFHLDGDPPIWSANVKADTVDPQVVRRYVDRVLDAHLKPGACDAILASNDLWGVQVVKSLRQRGVRVPDDIAVTGIDNDPIAAACHPELTTIDQRNDEYARCTLDLMSRMIEGRKIGRADRDVQVQPQLIIREST